MPTVVNVSEAKAHLSDLLARAQGGEEIIIARAGRPLVKLVAVEERQPREGGVLSYTLPESFFEPQPDEELQAWEGKVEPWDRSPDMRIRTHPGEVLREEFMAPLGISANGLAIALRVPATRIGEIVREQRGITADTALRLARYFGTSPEFWLNLQQAHDLSLARQTVGDSIAREVDPRAA
ncbi:HigA family addiction module antitoxin [Azospirillum sp. sgz301742]